MISQPATRAWRSTSRRVAPVAVATQTIWSRWLAPALATITSIGRAVLVITVIAWLLAVLFGWAPTAIVATAGVALLVVAALFMIGSTKLEITAVVEPPRVTVGESLTGEMTVRNVARTPLISAQVDFPIGTGGVSYDLPMLLPGREHSEIFVVPTHRRGVIPVGPATSVRGDPLGLFRRSLSWTERSEVFVHPRITPLEPLGAGLIRDLEGNSSQNVSLSDLSFHALREYVPGDDLRHIHWRSSARHGTLLVRQFLDTRRSHLTALVDSDPASYGSEEDFETAISVAASMMVRALQDGYDVTFLCGDVRATKQAGRIALDACSRAQAEARPVVTVAARGAQLAPDTSLLLLLTGSGSSFGELQLAASQFPVEVGRLAIRADSTQKAGLRASTDLPVLTLGALDELGSVLRWGLA